jgi:hypothetical protein
MTIDQATPFPPRRPWPGGFPPVVIHADESRVKKHPAYQAAKSGDADAAFQLVQETISLSAVAALQELIGLARPMLVSAHALEQVGVNAIPEALADELGRLLNLPVDGSVVQTNVVSHTGADGFSRLARQAAFAGDIVSAADYVMADDFVGQGGTLANLRGLIETGGGRVIAGTALTGKPHSALLAPTVEQLSLLRNKHGKDLEAWWIARFGHGFDCLTQSEARYLERTANVDAIRDRIAAAEQAGNSAASSGAPPR